MKYFINDPIYKLEKYCKILSTDGSIKKNNHSFIWHNTTSYKNDDSFNCQGSVIKKVIDNVTYYYYANAKYAEKRSYPEPNIALLSVTYVIFTCCMALILKKLRRSNFFSSYVSTKIMSNF